MTAEPQPIRIDDPADARLDIFRNIRDKDLRQSDGLFMAESVSVVRRLIRTPQRVHALLLTEKFYEHLRDDLADQKIAAPVYVADLDLMCSISGFHIHRGVLAAGKRLSSNELSLDAALGHLRYKESLLLLAAEGVTNIDNMGGLFRNAAAFGVDGIVLDPTCCDPLYRKAIRVSMGHVLSIPYAVSQEWPGDLVRLRDEWGVRIIAAESDVSGRPLSEIEMHNRGLLLMGSESDGLSRETTLLADEICEIPMAPGVPSLNVATAAAVCLYEIRRRV